MLYAELTGWGITIRVRGSRRPGLKIAWAAVIEAADMPPERPAKIGNQWEYLTWVKSKCNRKKAADV